jgi:O-antigen/teichoic acid export membrane protein
MLKTLGAYFSLGLIPSVMWLITIFILTHSLSPSDYGIGMLFVSSLELIGSLSGLGMDRVFMRFYYEKAYREKTALLLYSCLLFAGISILSFYFVAFFFSTLFSAVFYLNGIVVWLLMLIGTVAFVLEIYASFMPRFQNKPGLYTLGQIVQQSTFLLSCTLFILFSKKSSVIIMISQVVGLSSCSILLIFIYRNQWKIPTHLFRQLKTPALKELITYGFPFIFSGSLMWLFFNIDKFLILKWSGAHALGIYTAAFALCSPLEMLRGVFILGWIPILNKQVVESPFKGKKLLHDVFRQMAWIFTLVVSLLMLLKPVMILFLAKAYAQSENIVGWILISIYFYGLSDIVTAGIIKSKKTYWNIVISVICLMANVILCYFLIPRYGAEGAAIANASGFFLFFMMRYLIGFQYYVFKIQREKLFCYVFYLVCLMILSKDSHVDLQIVGFFAFIIVSFWMERSWVLVRKSQLKDMHYNKG